MELQRSPLEKLSRYCYVKTGLGGHSIPLKLTYEIDFEGFYGRASEDMESQWKLEVNNKVYKSYRFEHLDSFIIRICIAEGINLID